ncbi:MAG: hypothetical protein FWC41_11060, partial [Firmicutes bacterium]|nr:hypothetical protein [Bacillota bacterium]
LLDRIFHKKLGFHQAPKFIIVFDELDKIDPVYNNAVKTEHNIPEFESSTAFQGGSVSRDRKQNVLKLLGNMKLFMSQAEAKFVFISGRELYDAFLADLADREFAASSIFNGVIYVDSFLQSSTKQKNIITKTEEYICGYLIPKDWYSNNAKYQYNKETGKDDDIQHKYKLENITYRYPNLRMYKTFLIRTLINSFLFEILRDSSFKGYGENGNDVILDNDGVILDNFCVKKLFEKIKDLTFDNNKEFGDYEIKINNIPRKLRDILNLKFESYKDFENIVIKTINTFSKSRNEIEYKELFEEKLHDIEQLFQYVDKVVVFLNQFSIYLTHICNGSPKKITIYFEQYIKSFIPEHLKNPFSKCQNKDIRESHYCLSFTAIDQQNIGFINYVTYPIIQSVINQTSHFGDKMLVSVSFLIDHIFKHHKGGFSYENIEHTPELLEVYHIPNLRNTIDAILSFLRQNHVANICGGVYQYKFRRPIADEIMYNSRISEEISAIFNFTLDESLPVKRYYYKQIEYNEKKYLELEKRNVTGIIKNQYAITLISQLEILAEIYLLDEENNEAIQHFNTAYEIIKSELQKYNKESENEDKNKLHLFVLLIRIALKLGLAEEFKGYYDEAFALYNSLLGYLVGFRYLDDSELGLGYFYEDNRINNGDGEWKVKKIKLFHNIFGHTVKKNGCYDRDSFYTQEVLPFYRQNQHIRNQKIDFLIDGDYSATGLSKVLSPKKQDIISRLTLFSEVKPIFQAILANLFVVEKIDVNGITQENLDLAEDQFKYIYLLTDSKDKFIQAADFYKKMASILFLKNYSNAKKDEYLQMWGFDIYEAINEFCFINSNNRERIVDKFPKEILKEFFIDNIDKSWDVFIKKTNNINHLIDKLISDSKRKQDNPKYREIIEDFVEFGIEKRDKHIEDSELGKCIDCYACCSDRKLNHPCYACNYVSKSLDIFRRVFVAKKSHASPDLAESHRKYTKRESHFFKLLEFFTVEKT